MNEKLKKCPFCGGEATITKVTGGPKTHYFDAVCYRCHAAFDKAFSTEQEAVAAWNRRDYGWIDVNDRLPKTGSYDKPNTHVLCACGCRVFEGYLNRWGTWSRANAANTHDLPPITHWMPLPEPPK